MNGLVLSGGGASGCFSAGVLYRMFHEKKFSKIYGTSVGALNATLLAQAYVEDDPEIIKKVWTEKITKNTDVFNFNFLRLLTMKAPVSFEPLSKLAWEIADFKAIKKMDEEIITTSVDLLTGKTIYISNKNSTPKEFHKALIASSSIPFFTAPVKLWDKILVDGGIRENAPVRTIMLNNDVESILVILASPIDTSQMGKKRGLGAFRNTFKALTRSLSIMTGELTLNDLKGIRNMNQLLSELEDIVGKRKMKKIEWIKDKKIINADLIIPDKEIIEDILDFDSEKLKKGFDLGIEYGERYLKYGPRFDLEKLSRWTNYK